MGNNLDNIYTSILPEEERIAERDLQIYSNAIKGLAESQSPLHFGNRNHKHASVVISTIFDYSEKEIVFYEDDFTGNISKNNNIQCIEESLVNFIGRNGKIQFVLRENNNKLSKFGKKVKLYNELLPDSVIVKKASDTFRDYIVEKKGDIFFIVGDQKMYRVEDNIINEEGFRKGTAYGSFNQPDTAKELYDVFIEKLSTCEDYFLKE